jgi:hypothetical protein
VCKVPLGMELPAVVALELPVRVKSAHAFAEGDTGDPALPAVSRSKSQRGTRNATVTENAARSRGTRWYPKSFLTDESVAAPAKARDTKRSDRSEPSRGRTT